MFKNTKDIKLLKAAWLLQQDKLEALNERLDVQLDAIAHLSLKIVDMERLIESGLSLLQEVNKIKKQTNEIGKKRTQKRNGADNNTGRKTLPRSKK